MEFKLSLCDINICILGKVVKRDMSSWYRSQQKMTLHVYQRNAKLLQMMKNNTTDIFPQKDTDLSRTGCQRRLCTVFVIGPDAVLPTLNEPRWCVLISAVQIWSSASTDSATLLSTTLSLSGAQPGLKSRGGPRFGFQRPAKGRGGCWVREAVAPSRCEGPGVLTRKFFWKLRC